MRVQQRLLAAIVALGALAAGAMNAPQSAADIVSYGNYAGSNVQFIGVQESSSAIGSGLGQVPELYGAPTVVSNSLIFSPSLFDLMSVGAANEMLVGQLSFDLQAAPGYEIVGISISEVGDYSMSTPFPGGAAMVANAMSGFVLNSNGLFMQTSSFNNVHLNANGPGVFGVLWNNGIALSFDPVTSLTFDLDNMLNAASLAGSTAFIGKTGVVVDVLLVAIPEPGTALGGLAVLGLVGMVTLRRRTSCRKA
jgi:hypothetical protein